MAQGEKIIGIDLGTTNSVVAVMDGAEAKVIPSPEGVAWFRALLPTTIRVRRLWASQPVARR